MATSSRSAERFKYGICLNDECSLCKEKKVQQIPMRKELVCSECGKPLRECPPPPTGPDWKKIGAIIAAVVLVGGGIGAYFGLKGGNETPQEPPQGEPGAVIDSDSIKRAEAEALRIQDSLRAEAVKDSLRKIAEQGRDNETGKGEVEKPKPKPNPEPQPKPEPTTGTLKLSYGTYTGQIKGGYPNGQGRLVYNRERKINKYDSKKRIAQPGDAVQGTFVNGFITIGKHYDASGNLIESINVGTVDGVYEQK